ncbi:MAG: bifunctional glutamate N-acetyltransferase/amino-acid acetyltransferase ArgJ [Eubacteriales bacterium]|nr:bifunctional glutamate N-acetyltransferase/amino-acid acetyltransferase ArgJ [Eubacteriales bacterium]
MSSGVTFVPGFRASGVSCGLKKNGNPDFALVVSDVPAACAGVYTRNVVKGHSLQLCAKHSALGTAQAVAINSGCANACLGQRGADDALKMAQMVAQKVGCPVSQVLTGSTGVIGEPLDMDKIADGVQKAYAALSTQGGEAAAHAIMTTDTLCKQVSAQCTLGGKTVHMGAMAKGSGMIHPNMATMISVITTDANISAETLKVLIKDVADSSYNHICVDGDTSVCDTVVILANALADNEELLPGQEDYQAFVQMLKEQCLKLARMLAGDGEGATKLMEIHVNGAASKQDAKLIAQAISKSPLVKTDLFGEDANWGRILTAAGYSGGCFDPEKVDLYINSIQVCGQGCALAYDEAAVKQTLKKNAVTYRLELNQGTASDFMLGCDLTLDYVKINSDYRT